MSWITQGFVIAASISTIGASVAVVYALIKGRSIVETQLSELNDKVTEVTLKSKAKKAELDRLVDAAAALIKD